MVNGAEQEATELQCILNGIRFTKISPRDSSKTCPRCGNTDINNRVRKKFQCTKCGYRADSDLVSGRIMGVGDVQKVKNRSAYLKNLVKPRKNRIIPMDSS